MFQDMEILGYDHIKYFRDNRKQIEVDNNGQVRFVFIGTFVDADAMEYQDIVFHNKNGGQSVDMN